MSSAQPRWTVLPHINVIFLQIFMHHTLHTTPNIFDLLTVITNKTNPLLTHSSRPKERSAMLSEFKLHDFSFTM